MRPTLAAARRLCEKQGGDVSDMSGGIAHCIIYDSPAGKIWTGTLSHSIHAEWVDGFPGQKEQAIAEVLELLAHGLEPCPPDCECRSEAFADD